MESDRGSVAGHTDDSLVAHDLDSGAVEQINSRPWPRSSQPAAQDSSTLDAFGHVDP